MNTNIMKTFTFILLTWALLVSCKRIKVKECGNKPADVVFLLDSSGSIWAPEFRKQIRFVRDLIKVFDVSPDNTRIGLITFSNWGMTQFHLNSYDSKGGMLKFLRRIRQLKGDTNTASAIQLLREESFIEENGGRKGVPQIGIVLTDGKSNNPAKTIRESELARKQGIQLFAIGIGHTIELTELHKIAYNNEFVFTVAGFHALYKIKNQLARQTCKVTAPPPTEPVLVDQACGEHSMADIVFATSPSSGTTDTDHALNFFKNISAGLNIAEDKVRVGLVPRDCSHISSLTLDTLEDKVTIVNTLRDLESREGAASDPSHILSYMRTVSFQPGNGARERAQKIGVLLVDAKINGISATVTEAKKMAKEHNAQMFVVGVGKQASPKQMKKIATTADRHFFHVSNYDELHTLVHRMQNSICPVVDS